MKIAFNPSTVAALTSPPKNKDITFDLRGRNIFARGVEFKGTDTNTWRDIKINNVSIGSHTLDLRNGSNTTLTNTNGVVTINSTWRPVVDNLTSNSTTSSLSANQGRVLAGLINGKSDSDHNHDDRYLKLIGGTLTGNLVGTSAMFSGRFYGSGDDEGIIIKPSSNGYAGLILGAHDGERSIFYFVKNKPFWRYSHGSDKLDIIHPKKSGTIALTSDIPSSLKNPYALTISLNGTSQGPYDGSAAKNINITPGSIGAATSGHNHDGRYVYNYGGTQMDGASRNKNALGMSITSGISGAWWHILQAAWNDEYRWNSQIAFPTQNRNGMYYRSGLDDNTKWGAWVKLLDSNNYNTFHHLLTNGNTTVSTSTWNNPFSAYNKNAIADGQAICVWGQNSRKYSDNEKFSTDAGDISLWLKRVNANAATLNMVLDGEYYAHGNQRLAHVSEIPNKNSWNYDDRYLKLTGGTLKGQIILPDIDVNPSYTGSIIIGASNTENLGIDGNEIMARNNGKASTLYLNNEGGAVQLGAILRTNSNIAYIGSQYTQDMIKFINNTNDSYGNGIAIGGGGLTIIGSGESSDVVMSQHSSGGDENMIIAGDGNIDFYSNLQDGWKYGKHMYLDTNGFLFTPSYINIGGNENNNSSPDRVWGSNSSDSYLRSYRTSALNVANADTVDGYHASGLWRSDGGTWNPGANISLKASGNNQEWSFDIYRNGHTGCYWQVWDNTLSTLLKVNADNGKVYAPYNFVGNLEGNANTANTANSANSATNADKVDGWHKDEINRTLFITSGTSGLSSYWAKLWEINLNNQYNDVTITFLAAASYYPSYFSIFSVYLRQNGSGTSKSISARLVELIGNIAVGDTELRLYVNNTTGNCQLWGNVKIQYGTMNLSVLKKAWRTNTDSSNIGTFFSTSFSSVQSLPGDGWYKVGVIQQSVVGAFNPSSHTHTWTSITDKIVAGNEFNIVNAGFNSELWFNYKPINDASKTATISQYIMGNGAKGIASIKAAGFIKNGGNENQLLRADGGVAGFNWSGQSGQPTWLWGGNNFNSYYVYNPSNFRVAYASSAGNSETLGGFPKNYGQAPFGTIPCIGNDGVMEIGKYIDFHNDNSGKHDYSTRLQTTGNYGNSVNLPSASGTLALISQVLTWKSQIIDMRSYSESYWHPVTVPLPNFGYNKIKVSVQLNSGDKPSWATHNSGITCNMEIWATSSGWGTTDSDTICLNYTYKFCSQNPCGWMQLGNPSLGVVFLRGGSRYTVYTDFDAVFTPHNQKYTWSNDRSSQDTGGPYTSCPGLNFNMGTIRTDLIATLVQARRVCAGHDPGIDNSISCSNWFRSSGNTGWYNTTYQGGWYMSDTSWIRAHNNVGIYTGGQIYSSSSVKAGDICLDHTDEINNITNNGIHLNYRNSGNVSLCVGGGKVGIGIMGPTQKLDVNGGVKSSGFHHSSVNSDNYMLLAGGGYKSFGGDNSNPIFLGYLNLDHGNDGTISSSFLCLGYSVPFTYTRGGNYCRIYIPDTTHQVFYIGAATASVHYSGGGMNTWTGVNRGSGAWWLHCYAEGTNEVRVKGFCQRNGHNDSWWGGNPLWSGNDGVNRITVCIFGYVKFR